MLALALLAAAVARAQLTDVTQTPNTENEGIRKSLEEQVGAGQGDELTPDSSALEPVLFPPDDTPSDLDPGDPGDPDSPQRGHGSIALTARFSDPEDIE